MDNLKIVVSIEDDAKKAIISVGAKNKDPEIQVFELVSGEEHTGEALTLAAGVVDAANARWADAAQFPKAVPIKVAKSQTEKKNAVKPKATTPKATTPKQPKAKEPPQADPNKPTLFDLALI